MTIQDAIAEVVYQHVLAHPERCPADLLREARRYQQNKHSQRLGHSHSFVWLGFVETLQKHAGEISEILCTENGQDARKD